jgi:excisionase family DNA binding protein
VTQDDAIFTAKFVRWAMPIQLRRSKCRPDPTVGALVSPHVPAVAPLAAVPPAGVELEPPGPPFLSLREAADWLCVSITTLNRMIVSGDLIPVRVGKIRKIPASHLAAYIARDILLPK